MSNWGLIYPDFKGKDARGAKIKYTFQNVIQEYNWDLWKKMISKYKNVSYVIANGDIIDGKNYRGVGHVATTDPYQQIDMAAEFFRDFSSGTEIHITRGTGYHCGDDTIAEELIADKIGCEYDDEIIKDIGGIRVFANHHSAHTKNKAASIETKMKEVKGAQNYYGKIDLLVLSHNHIYTSVQMRGMTGVMTPCIPEYTSILTADGRFSMGELDIGDLVPTYSPTGISMQHISDIYDRGVKSIITIKTSNTEINCTADHPILTVIPICVPYNNGTTRFKVITKLEWKKAGELSKGDMIVKLYKLPDNNKSYVLPDGTETTEDFMRLVGCYLGDGITSQHRVFELALFDQVLPSKYINILSNLGYTANYCESKGVRACSVKLVTLIDSLDLGKYSYGKHVPKWVFTLPHSQIRALIEGYIDADGHTRKTYPHFHTFKTVSEELAKDINSLANIVGYGTSRIHKRAPAMGGIDSTGNTICGKHDIYDSDIYSNKYRRVKPNGLGHGLSYNVDSLPEDFEVVTITDICNAGEDHVYDIAVTNTHNYIAENLVVHNCWQHKTPYAVSRNLISPSDLGWVIINIDDENKITVDHSNVIECPNLQL